MRPRLCAVVLAASLALNATASAARDPRAQKTARAHFLKAEKAFNLGRFDDALAAYERAFDALALPGFLFNIAQCHRNLENHERALFFFRRYLALDPETPNRALVEELVAEEEQKVAEQVRARARARATLAAQNAEEAAAARPAASLMPAPPKPPSRLVKAPRAEGTTAKFVRDNWLWLGIGSVVVAGIATALVIGSGGSAPPTGDLGTWDLRRP